jgi:hypothetical protein
MAGATASEFARSYTTLSGCDIKAVFANKTIGELQAISVQVTREKAGIYTMGDPNPRSFSRGKRGIAGSAIVIQFDRDAILHTLSELQFQGDIDELRPAWAGSGSGDDPLAWSLRASSGSNRTAATPVGAGIDAAPSLTQQESDLTSVDSDQLVMSPFYADQVPPFDITLAAANEYGDLAVMGIFGVEFLNEGWGISIDDLVSEKQYTYLARLVSWWKWLRNPNQSALAGGRAV